MNKKTKSILWNSLIALVVVLLLWPTSRAYFQQGLMKVGIFKPTLSSEAPAAASAQNQQEAESQLVLAPPIRFRDVQGKVISLADLKGKVVFINFWATWCPPCVAEMPSIEKLYQQFKDEQDIVFLTVEIESDAQKATEFMSSKKLNLPIYFPDTAIDEAYISGAIPTTVVIDKQGAIASRHEGMADYSSKEVTDYISALIKQ